MRERAPELARMGYGLSTTFWWETAKSMRRRHETCSACASDEKQEFERPEAHELVSMLRACEISRESIWDGLRIGTLRWTDLYVHFVRQISTRGGARHICL